MLFDILFPILGTWTFCKELKRIFCICEGNVHVLRLVNATCQLDILKTKALLVVWHLKAFPVFIYVGVCVCVHCPASEANL